MCVPSYLHPREQQKCLWLNVQHAEACSDWVLAVQELVEDEKETAIEARKAMYVATFFSLSETVVNSVLASLNVSTTLDGEMNLTVYQFHIVGQETFQSC
jgi:hypothetical protein